MASIGGTPLPRPEPSRHPVDVGHRTEVAILNELVRRGYHVLVPFGVNRRYDLMIDLGDRFLRVQCKTGRLREGVVYYSAQSVRSNTKGSICRPYTGEIDLFMVYCPDNDQVYAVPIDEATSTLGTLRLTPSKNGQVKRIRWARDYELPA